jgi:hypothetical protein
VGGVVQEKVMDDVVGEVGGITSTSTTLVGTSRHGTLGCEPLALMPLVDESSPPMML